MIIGEFTAEWLFTDDEDDCVITTTETPTTTATPGCCKGTSRTSNAACNAIADADQCDRRSSCTFIAFGILDIDCVFDIHTDPPSEPGCCVLPAAFRRLRRRAAAFWLAAF